MYMQYYPYIGAKIRHSRADVKFFNSFRYEYKMYIVVY